MKTKLLFVLLGSVAGSLLHAQTTTSKTTANGITFGVRAGVNFQNTNGKDGSGNKLNNKVTTGFNAGVNAEIPVGTDTYIQPGVLYSLKGAKVENSDAKIHLSYLEIPVNFLYKPLLGTGHMLLGFGPYAAFGMGGNLNTSGTKTDVVFTNTYNTNNAAPQFKRFDAGGNLLVGYELANNFSLQLNAQLGLVKINPDYPNVTNDKTSWKNTGFGISAGYRF